MLRLLQAGSLLTTPRHGSTVHTLESRYGFESERLRVGASQRRIIYAFLTENNHARKDKESHTSCSGQAHHAKGALMLMELQGLKGPLRQIPIRGTGKNPSRPGAPYRGNGDPPKTPGAK